MRVDITTSSAEETEAIARSIGGRLRGGECIEFISDLGGGKTTFVRGLAYGAGSKDAVSSPTFTVSQEYDCSKFIIKHYDFYRLPEPGLVAQELSENISDDNEVTVIEWAESVNDILPSRLIVTINKQPGDENGRKFTMDTPEKLDYLLREIA